MRAFFKTIGRSRIAAAFVLTLMVLMINCSDQQLGLEPLPSSSGAVVTGVLRAGNDLVEGATVRLEPIYGGLTLSVSMAIDRAGGIPVSPVEYSSDILVTVSDLEGRYFFDGLDTGTYMIGTQAKDHTAGSAYANITPELAAASDTTFVDIDLVPTGTFTGNVFLQNADNYSSTVVYVTGSSNVAVTNMYGHYELKHVPIGEHTIQATHTGWIDDDTNGTLAAAGDSVHLSSMTLMRDANMAPEVEIDPLADFPVASIFDETVFTATAEDPDGDIVLVEWDFTDDGTFDLEGDVTVLSTTYAPPDTGTYRAKIRVTDDDGAIGLAVLNYYVHDAIYVWGEEGNDTNPGTASQPVQTITQGITLAEVTGQPVIVHLGSYWEEVIFKSNVSIYGGYDRESGWTRTPGNYSQVWLQSYYEHVATA
ncbi:PKD domain-containing protein, partial [bacterium]|nr:PKD domain-containing protein [bacterium]